ncbi:MAG: hypothetical protein RDU20_20095, partial [Desulfomonilaceae bacterium]|nr:hypothetical protein [Desulfomonilaceae bacterium]
QFEFPYYNIFDKNGVRSLANRFFLTYRAGNVDAGAIYCWLKWHAGPESQSTQADRNVFTTYDELLTHGAAYFKYTNGTVFFNTELAFLERITKRQGAGALYFESWRYMTEFGAYFGPAKISFLYTYLPGPDRRAGIRIDKQPFQQMQPFSCHNLHRAYSFLLGYEYGGGVDAFDLNGNGYINDAAVLAAKVDYAAAANLNFFGSILWAQRTSHGYGWGYIRPAQQATVTRVMNAGGTVVDDVRWSPTIAYRSNGGPTPAPSISDRDLGWEMQVGFHWGLLEQLTVRALMAYWQPGKWFNFACVDRGVPNWDVPGPGNNWGTNPGRTIDGVVGAEVVLQAEF